MKKKQELNMNKKKEKIVEEELSNVPVKYAHKTVKRLLVLGIRYDHGIQYDQEMKEKKNRKSLRGITRSEIENLNEVEKKVLELTPGKKSKSKISKMYNVKSKINKANNVQSKMNKANSVKNKINKACDVKNIKAQEASSSNVQQKQIKKIVDVQPKKTHVPKLKYEKVNSVKNKINKACNVKNIKAQEAATSNVQQRQIKKIVDVQQKKIHVPKLKCEKVNSVKNKINKACNVKNIEAQEASSLNVQQKQIKEIVDVQQKKTHVPKVKETTKNESSNSQLSRKRKRTNSETQELRKSFDPKMLPKEQILGCISVIRKLIEAQSKDKNELLPQEAKPIFMQVTCVKIPVHPPGQMKLLLPYSMVLPDDEIALFVPDLENRKRRDYETTIEHYRELLEANECTQITKIIPLYQVRTEYNQFELKRKLAASYDHFLVDGRISGPIWHFVGKAFHDKRKTPIPLRMTSKNLKREIDYALRKTGMHIHSYGDTQCVQVGTTLMKRKEILQNILATCNHLNDHYPGSWDNVRALRLKGETTIAVPIYLTLKNKNTVDQPVVNPKRPKAYRDVEGEVSTIGDKIVVVKPEGDVIVKTMKKKKEKLSVDRGVKRTKKM